MDEHGFHDINPQGNPGIQSDLTLSIGIEADRFNYDVETLLLQSHDVYKAAKEMHLQHGKIKKRGKKRKNEQKLEKSKTKYRLAGGNCTDALKRVIKVFQKHETKGEHGVVQERRGRPKPRASSVHGYDKDMTRPKIPEQFRCENCPGKTILNEKLQQEVNDLKKRYEAEKNQRERYEYMYREEHAAKEDALRRLSSLASSNLRDNNPNITDLSDQNRPTKIAEKMSELYDNEWTEAYDALEQQQIGERQIIQTLLDTFMEVYHRCSRLAQENFFERVQRSIEMPVEGSRPVTDKVVLPDQLKQQVKEFRKTRAPVVVKDIKMVVQQRLRTTFNHLDEFRVYISRCIEIGWLCAVQDPPVVVKAQAPAIFDTNSFKDYTSRGQYTEYVVWPALYLHDGGPLLSKGVAQGSNYAQTFKNEASRSAYIGNPQEKLKTQHGSPNHPGTVHQKQNKQVQQDLYSNTYQTVQHTTVRQMSQAKPREQRYRQPDKTVHEWAGSRAGAQSTTL